MALVTLARTQNITTWFLLIYSDSIVIYICQKFRQANLVDLNQISVLEHNKKLGITKNKLLGVILVFVSNLLFAILRSNMITVSMGAYLILSCYENWILETGGASLYDQYCMLPNAIR